jgi:hypothetical protein
VVGRDHPAGADAVLDHDGRVPILAHLVGEQPRQQIGRAAGGESDDEADRLRGVSGLRSRDRRGRDQRGARQKASQRQGAKQHGGAPVGLSRSFGIGHFIEIR